MTQRKRILLVDDDRDFVEATTAVLESVYEVEVAYGGGEAMAKARASKPDLILLDVIMPDEDGFAVCDQLKADPQLADVPVIMLTSLPDGLGQADQEAVCRGLSRKAGQADGVVEAGHQVPGRRGAGALIVLTSCETRRTMQAKQYEEALRTKEAK